MKENTKKVVRLIAFGGVVIGALVGWSLYSKYAESRTEATERDRTSKEQARGDAVLARLSALAGKYNAVTDWREALQGKWSRTFTVNLEDALVRKDGRPVLFRAAVNDVKRDDGTYVVSFVVDDGGGDMYEFSLDCSDAQIAPIMQHEVSRYSTEAFAIVGEIKTVKRVNCRLKATGGDSSEARISVDLDRAVFVASGRCLDVVFLGD